ncbi:MAG: hybrid sensor histidine kinase/response regulator [Candidatus Riflebacteria bacterium]|nr:hybrid sensor histidine kinase/response regulator [Candidatus Riflebacteria bacterium]
MTPERKKEGVLIVDDVVENIEVIGGILRPYYEVKLALNGSKALKIAESENPPDLILLDIMMPKMDGFEVCRRLKQNPKTQNIPVIFVTAKNEDIDEAKGLEIGAVDYLVKPVNPVIVKARVKTHISLASAMRELEKQKEILQENLSLREEIELISRHDLKGPLSVFLGVPEILNREKNLSPRQLEILKILDQSTHKMLKMINRSLDLAKMEKGKYPLKPVPVNIVKVIRQVYDQLNPLATGKTLKTHLLVQNYEADSDASFIIPGEEFLYYCLFLNLIKNAMEASPEKQAVTVTISSGDRISIEVKNRGEIPPEIRNRFFEKYVTHGKDSGTGLGVYSAQLMAKTLGGTLRFTTSKEKGTSLIFEITLPEA